MKTLIFDAGYPDVDRDFIRLFAGEIKSDKNSKEKISKVLDKYGVDIYSIILSKLTNIKFIPEEAKKIWDGILKHRAHMRMLLKRDVRIEVAVLDYFLSINNEINKPIVLEESLFNSMKASIIVDELTGLYNYRYYKIRIEEELAYAKRYNTYLSIAIFDIDNFKRWNDKFGHNRGKGATNIVGKLNYYITSTPDNPSDVRKVILVL